MILCPPSTDSNCVRKMSSSCPAPNVFLTNFAACSIRIRSSASAVSMAVRRRASSCPSLVRVSRSAQQPAHDRAECPLRGALLRADCSARDAHLDRVLSPRQMLLRRRQIFRCAAEARQALFRASCFPAQQVSSSLPSACSKNSTIASRSSNRSFRSLRRAGNNTGEHAFHIQLRPARCKNAEEGSEGRCGLRLLQKFSEYGILDWEVQPFIAAQQRRQILPAACRHCAGALCGSTR